MKAVALPIIFLAILVSTGTAEKPHARPEFTTDSNYLYLNGKLFYVKGVVYSPYHPGEPGPGAGPPQKANIQRDFLWMKEANVNSIFLYDFVERKDLYENARKQEIYIIQGIYLDAEAPDFQETRFKKRYQEHIKFVVDAVHNLKGEDYSDTVLAYKIGEEMRPNGIFGTDAGHSELKGYQGKFVGTSKSATPSESFLAEMADFLKGYCSEKYGHVPLVTYAGYALTDHDFKDLGFLDFISQNVTCFWPEEVTRFRPVGKTTGTPYQGYLSWLKSRHPKKPVVITNFWHSCAPQNPYTGGKTEDEQAEGITSDWKDITTCTPPLGGGMVFLWNDLWWPNFHADLKPPPGRDCDVHEPWDYEEWTGLIAFEGADPSRYIVRKRKAYDAVRQMFAENLPYPMESSGEKKSKSVR